MYFDKEIWENDKYRLEIQQDEHPENPREWDNQTKMICFSNRYNLGDKHAYSDQGQFIEQMGLPDDSIQLYCLVAYEHGLIQLAIDDGNMGYPFSCPWDSYKIGYIYMPKNNLTIKEINTIMKQELAIYNQYLEGEVYGYILSKKIPLYELVDGDYLLSKTIRYEEVGSLWGMFSKSEIFDNVAIEGLVKK